MLQQVKEGMQQKLRKCVEVQEHKEERKRDTSRITYVTRRVQEHYSWGCKQKKIGQDTEQNHYQNEIVDQTKVKIEIRVRSLRRHPNVSPSTAINVKEVI